MKNTTVRFEGIWVCWAWSAFRTSFPPLSVLDRLTARPTRPMPHDSERATMPHKGAYAVLYSPHYPLTIVVARSFQDGAPLLSKDK